ncbi:alpha/beta hydrolase [Metabacillus arenae]|uniref:Alpha/beta hydrolase n=1 Tax=Metabacillus arenae TaxID=2771434 RepID=A0A926S2B5_9BACI|nr:alpha/beta hydrolase [Metabacillus arenae]MBD1381844.1 alpha/beta hydrolase [Metabacillus arenae]
MTFDYRSFGESEGVPRQVVDIQGQIEDFHAAIKYAREYEGLDSERIALWGSLLGGGHVISAASQDPRIAAVVAQIPFNGFPRKVEGRSTITTIKILAAMIRDLIRKKYHKDPYYIRAVGNIGELAVMSSSEAHKTIEAMASKNWKNEIAPRALFEMMKYKPSDAAPNIKAPVLICYGEHDLETTSDTTKELVAKLVNCETKSYPVAHFDFYREGIRDKITSDQIAFLKKNM